MDKKGPWGLLIQGPFPKREGNNINWLFSLLGLFPPTSKFLLKGNVSIYEVVIRSVNWKGFSKFFFIKVKNEWYFPSIGERLSNYASPQPVELNPPIKVVFKKGEENEEFYCEPLHNKLFPKQTTEIPLAAFAAKSEQFEFFDIRKAPFFDSPSSKKLSQIDGSTLELRIRGSKVGKLKIEAKSTNSIKFILEKNS